MGKCSEWMKGSSWGQGWTGQEWGLQSTEECKKLSQRARIRDEKGRRIAENRGENKGGFVVFLVQDDFPIQSALHICVLCICKFNQPKIKNIKKNTLHCYWWVWCSWANNGCICSEHVRTFSWSVFLNYSL